MNRRIPKLAKSLCFCLILASGTAIAATYSSTPAVYNFISSSKHTTIAAWPGCGDTTGNDSLSAALNLGFTFNYGGVDYTQVRVHTNGRLQFNNTTCGAGNLSNGPPRTYPAPYPDATLDRTLRVYGADFDVSANGKGDITYATTGAAPNRIFVVTWNKVQQWEGAGKFGNATSYNLQVQLHESGDFYFMYGTSDDISQPSKQPMGPAQIGWQLSTSDYVVLQTGLPANKSGFHFFIPGAVAEYRFDQGTLSGAAGEVLDSSGSGFNGTRINSPNKALKAQTVPVGKVCQALSIPQNVDLNQKDAIDTLIKPTTIGSQGTITFWYKATAKWGGNDRVLFDATKTKGEDFYFSINASGQLRFVVTDNAKTGYQIRLIQAGGAAVAAGTWTHLAVTWRLTVGGAVLTIYRGGASVATISDTSNGALNTSLNSLYIGDNRASTIELGKAAQSADGLIDEFRMYDFEATPAVIKRDLSITRNCSVIDHFGFNHAGSGVTCQAATVSLTAHLSDHTTYTAYQGAVTLSTSTARGDWSLISGAGTLDNGAANDGGAAYTYAAADNGTVQLGLKDTVAETVNFNVTDGAATEKTGSAIASDDQDLSFAATGFAFLANGTAGVLGTQIAGKSSNVAPGAQTLELQAIRTSDSTGACVAALAGAQSVLMGYECVNPSTCTGAAFNLSGANIAANASGAVGNYTPVALNFDAASGRAPVVATYFDAGSVRLYARYEIPLGSGGGSGTFMQGSSNTFVSRPFALALTVPSNPGASSASGAKFVTAGSGFNANVKAVAWSAADDSNNDGIADGHQATDLNPANNANLSDNLTTSNFKPVTATALGARLVLPTPGTDPGLKGTTSVTLSSGTAAASGLRYDDVGITELSAAQSGDYLGIGAAETAKIRGLSGYVGRFYPKRFQVTANVPLFDNRCVGGAFTYLDQPFYFGTAPQLTVTALNALGAVTPNYTRAGFFKLNSTLAGRSYINTAGVTATFSALNGGGANLSGSTGGTGSAVLALPAASAGDTFNYARTQLLGPFAAAVTARYAAADLRDSDNVCYDSNNDLTCDVYDLTSIAGANLRFGRLVSGNAYGSEVIDLAVPARTEYFTGAGFTPNLDDSCTALPISAFDLGVDGSVNPPAQGDPRVAVGAGTSTATTRFQPVVAGDLGLHFSAPGAGNTGDVDYRIDLSLATGAQAEWLRYDWDGNGAYDNDPSGRISFGIYSGRTSVIYIREPW